MILIIDNPQAVTIAAKKMEDITSHNLHNYTYEFSDCNIKFANGVKLYAPEATIHGNSANKKMTIQVR